VKILPRAGAVVAAASWLVAVVLRSYFAAVAAHWFAAADSAAVASKLGLAADAVASELALAAVVVWEIAPAVVVVWELGLAAAGAVAAVSLVEPAAAFQV